ncbi:hypothetical protein [Rhodococcus marinonascens]|uniref:hypothetical protein n=1 Tax=Rhodococcus marinonascens TaxID=38311 RepID=UPI000A7A09BB|nr:hypothetical protein [Rhodococcus marinonascens]
MSGPTGARTVVGDLFALIGDLLECQVSTNPCAVDDADELTCTVGLDWLATASYTLGFDFVRGDELVAHGKITYAVRSAEGTKAPIPDRLLTALNTLESSSYTTA